MKKILFYSSCILITLGSSGCKKFLGVNTDPNNPLTVPEALILSSSEAYVSNNIAGGSASQYVNEWMQNVTYNQPVPNIDTYQVTNSNFDGMWTDFYATTMDNLVKLDEEAMTDSNYIYAGMAKVLLAYTLGNATDLWGDVPYSKAFGGSSNYVPTYDSQDTIYLDLQGILDSAITELQARSVGKAPGADDFFYGGNSAEWVKAAYLLKARFDMHLTGAPGHTAAAQATLALADLQNSMTANSDDMTFPYTGGAAQTNPIFQNYGLGSASTMILSTNILDSLVSRNDPRLYQLAAPATLTGLFTGRQDGQAGSIGTLLDYSNPGPFYGYAPSPMYILNYTEAIFLKAEATFILSGATAATPIYQQGIITHFQKLGLNPNADSCQAYLALRGTLTSANAYEYIMTEKTLSNYFSLENYVDFRRTGHPQLTLVPNASVATIPTRFLYSQTELTSNPQPQQTAKITDKLWWQGN
jgi:hypothetical protein